MIHHLKSQWSSILLGLILLVGGWFAAYRLAEPAWEMNHHGYILAEWSHNAVNYVRFGLETRTGVVTNYGWARPEEGFTYRADHPPLAFWLIALSHCILGIHDWSARLPLLLFSLGLVVVIFMFTRRIAGQVWALLAAVFAIGSPGFQYYARLPGPHVVAMFFIVATFIAYRDWTIRREHKYPWVMWCCFALGCWTDWITYFVMPWILLHYLLFHHRRQPDRRFLLVSFLLPFALFTSHLVWSLAAGGMDSLQELARIFLWRTASSVSQTSPNDATTRGDLFRLSYEQLKLFLTLPLCVLTLTWTVSFIIKVFKRSVSVDGFLVFCLFSYGLVHNLVFRHRMYFHDFLMVFEWLPYFAIAGSLGAQILIWFLPLRHRLRTSVVLVLLLFLIFFWQTQATLNKLHGEQIRPSLYFVGTRVNEEVPREAKIMSSFRPDIRMAYYIDRPWTIVTTQDEFDLLLEKEPSYSHYVLSAESSIDEALRKRLIANYAAQDYGDFAVFDLRSSMPAADELETSHRTNVHFGDEMALLGYAVEPTTLSPAREMSSWEPHFNTLAEQMPAHNTRLQLVYYWQALKPIETHYTIQTRLVADYGNEYAVEQTHDLASNIYPPSVWQVGEVVRKEYEVMVPAGSPPLRYDLRLGVTRKGTDSLLPVSEPGQTDDEVADEAKLGYVDLQPRQLPVPLSGEPAIKNRLERAIGSSLVFLGYDGPFRDKGQIWRPRQPLELNTYWLCKDEIAKDIPVWLELSRGKSRMRSVLDIEPTRLWKPGEVYERQGKLELSHDVLAGEYDAALVIGGNLNERIGLGKVQAQWDGSPTWVIDQTGLANGEKGDVRPLDTDREIRLNFSLDRPLELTVRAGWVGESLVKESWVEVYLWNRLRERYLTTWVVPRGRYTTSTVTVPQDLTISGENSIILRVPEHREKPHYVGWRAWVDAVFPDLLYDASGPHDGWVWADFVRVDTKWQEEWGAYRDLAQLYNGLEMHDEVARLFERAIGSGLRPSGMKDLNVFVESFEKLGDTDGLAQVNNLSLSLIQHPMHVNLGDKVEFLGFSLERGGEAVGVLHLYFRTLQPMEEDYTVWLHQYDRSTDDFVSLDRLVGTSKWQTGQAHEEIWTVRTEGERVRFVFGLWRWEDGSRLWIKDAVEQHEIDLGWVPVPN